jgi:hypothetical protein
MYSTVDRVQEIMDSDVFKSHVDAPHRVSPVHATQSTSMGWAAHCTDCCADEAGFCLALPHIAVACPQQQRLHPHPHSRACAFFRARAPVRTH